MLVDHPLLQHWPTLRNIKEQAMVYLLINEERKQGELTRPTKPKYKKIIKNIFSIVLTN